MARRRMFSLDVVDTDRFLDMPSSTQALYFHLGMRADDDGFVASPKRTTAMCGCSADDLNLLAAKGFVKPFESGVLVIVDWKKNNLIRPDRYTPTQFQEEKAQLGIPAVNQTATRWASCGRQTGDLSAQCSGNGIPITKALQISTA